jgi:glycosyltransferase involved in cell wall biosynthesis
MTDAGAGPRRNAGDVSVVVCTYNRAQLIGRALTHIGEAAARAGIEVEIIVVDNNSRDTTKEVVARAAEIGPVPIRYVFEGMQGLSFARNCGMRHAKGDVVAFTDDDCVVDPEWIAALWREFDANPDVAIVGGRVDLFSPEDRPVSIRTGSERIRYTRADQIYSLVMGANLAVRRGIEQRIGGFDPAFGGSKGVVADDIEFVYRAFKRGLGIVYTPEAKVLHNHGRRTPEDLRALGLGYVRGRGAFFCKYLLRADRTIMRHAWWELGASGVPSKASPGTLSRGETLGALASGALHFVLTRARLARP